MRSCDLCSEPLHPTKRADARFCSARCRVASHRRLPPALVERDRWVRHDEAKAPLKTDGRYASVTVRHTWSSHQDAAASTVGVGLGFVLNGDGIVCLDLDGVLVDGRLVAWAEDLVASLPPTYVEISRSGRGLHIFGYGTVARGRRWAIPGGGGVEIYGDGRYIAVTGKTFRSGTKRLADLDVWLRSVLRPFVTDPTGS